MRFSLSLLTALVGTAAAISITSPKKNEDVNLSGKVTVEWTSVSSDPSSFDIYLVKMNSYPPVNQLVGENVKTSDGSYTIDGIATDNGSGYQVNFVSKDPLNSGILAQSQQFNVESSSSGSSSSAASTTETKTTSSTSSASTTGKATTDSTSTSFSTSASTSASASTSTSATASTSGTQTKDKASSTASPSGTSSPSATPNGAGALTIPAGSLLMGLAVLAL